MVFIAVISWWYKLQHYHVKKEMFILFHQTRNTPKLIKMMMEYILWVGLHLS